MAEQPSHTNKGRVGDAVNLFRPFCLDLTLGRQDLNDEQAINEISRYCKNNEINIFDFLNGILIEGLFLGKKDLDFFILKILDTLNLEELAKSLSEFVGDKSIYESGTSDRNKLLRQVERLLSASRENYNYLSKLADVITESIGKYPALQLLAERLRLDNLYPGVISSVTKSLSTRANSLPDLSDHFFVVDNQELSISETGNKIAHHISEELLARAWKNQNKLYDNLQMFTTSPDFNVLDKKFQLLIKEVTEIMAQQKPSRSENSKQIPEPDFRSKILDILAANLLVPDLEISFNDLITELVSFKTSHHLNWLDVIKRVSKINQVLIDKTNRSDLIRELYKKVTPSETREKLLSLAGNEDIYSITPDERKRILKRIHDFFEFLIKIDSNLYFELLASLKQEISPTFVEHDPIQILTERLLLDAKYPKIITKSSKWLSSKRLIARKIPDALPSSIATNQARIAYHVAQELLSKIETDIDLVIKNITSAKAEFDNYQLKEVSQFLQEVRLVLNTKKRKKEKYKRPKKWKYALTTLLLGLPLYLAPDQAQSTHYSTTTLDNNPTELTLQNTQLPPELPLDFSVQGTTPTNVSLSLVKDNSFPEHSSSSGLVERNLTFAQTIEAASHQPPTLPNRDDRQVTNPLPEVNQPDPLWNLPFYNDYDPRFSITPTFSPDQFKSATAQRSLRNLDGEIPKITLNNCNQVTNHCLIDAYGGGISHPAGGAAVLVANPFGNLNTELYGENGVHTGIDFLYNNNQSSFQAAFDGVVVAVGPDTLNPDQPGLGSNVVVIRTQHPIGIDNTGSPIYMYAVYGHGESASVYPGQKVTAGQELGQTGNQGRSTGTHLHIEIRLGTLSTLTPYPVDFNPSENSIIDPTYLFGDNLPSNQNGAMEFDDWSNTNQASNLIPNLTRLKKQVLNKYITDLRTSIPDTFQLDKATFQQAVDFANTVLPEGVDQRHDPDTSEDLVELQNRVFLILYGYVEGNLTDIILTVPDTTVAQR